MKTITPEQKEGIKKEFQENFECIQSGCDGSGNIPRPIYNENGVEWEAGQCQFHAEYLNEFEKFLEAKLDQAYQQGYEEAKEKAKQIVLEEIKNKIKPDVVLDNFMITAEYRLGELRGYNKALNEVLSNPNPITR